MVLPNGNSEPDGSPAVWAMLLPAQLSAGVGSVQVTNASHAPASLLTVMLVGRATIVGFSLSVTVTVNDAANVFDAASVAV